MKKLIVGWLIAVMFTLFAVTPVVAETSVDSVLKTEIPSTAMKIYEDVKVGISSLATSLKVPAEHVYNVLVKQQVVVSYSWLFVFVAAIILLILSSTILWKFAEKNEDDSDGASYAMPVICMIIGIILIVIAVFHIDVILGGFINPEYGAIKTILDLLQ